MTKTTKFKLAVMLIATTTASFFAGVYFATAFIAGEIVGK